MYTIFYHIIIRVLEIIPYIIRTIKLDSLFAAIITLKLEDFGNAIIKSTFTVR